MQENSKLKVKIKVETWKIWLAGMIAVVVAAACFLLGYIKAWDKAKKLVLTIHAVREYNQEYSFISPLLIYDFNQAKSFFEDKKLEDKIKQYIDQQYKQNPGESISVAVRNYGAMGWAGVNQNTQYHPGSMMKVIIMLGFLRQDQQEQELLNKTLVYTQADDQQNNSLPFTTKTDLKVGSGYTIEYLIKDMIANSDNGAETLLINNIDANTLNQVYMDLGLQSPDQLPEDYVISPDQYTDFLRILYNSTYLTEQNSELALSIMSQSTYNDGIRAGVPQGIPVAQKYGERVDSEDGKVAGIELSNCGMVYLPNRPYSICIMTKKPTDEKKGPADEATLAATIKNITKIVNDYISNK